MLHPSALPFLLVGLAGLGFFLVMAAWGLGGVFSIRNKT
jgi:hypothetical protein